MSEKKQTPAFNLLHSHNKEPKWSWVITVIVQANIITK